MKVKIITVSVLLSLSLLAGCIKNPAGDESSLNESNLSGDTTQTQSESATEIPGEIKKMFSNTAGWDFNPETIRADVEFKIPDYTPVVNEYDFSLEDIVNRNQFTGFTQGQEEMLEQNGFVVLKPAANSPLKIHHFYEKAVYYKIPLFITSDAILHMYHLFYSESLRLLEISEYLPAVENLAQSMLDKSLLLLEQGPESVKPEMEIVTAYFAIAASLLEIPVELPPSVKMLVDEELNRINASKERLQSEVFNQMVDYTQFKPRGHYTMTEEFEKYFRTMMWYGLSGFQISTFNEKGEEIFDETALKQTLLTTCLILAGGSEDIDTWVRIYDLTSLYSGTSDDLNVLDFKGVIEEVFGKAPSLEMLTDSSGLNDLLEAVKKMRSPQIVPKILDEAKLGKSFRLMGQRYSLDSDILQTLMKPLKRSIPTAFDVLSAMGNPVAEDVLYQYHQTDQDWPEYPEELSKLKTKISGLDEGFWQKDLYSGWLWSIESAAKSFENESKMPSFMLSRAWSHKSLVTALGSFTELKYNNVLYSKQAMAEMGGPSPADLYHYVEPNVELYSKLQWLVDFTKENLRLKLSDNNPSLVALDYMSQTLETMIICSIKQLENKPLSQDEMQEIREIGGLIDFVNYSMLGALKNYIPDYGDENTSALITDVATILGDVSTPTQYLQEAIGMPYDIFVIANINGKKVLTRGTVYSYFEFLSLQRMTDADWHKLIGLEEKVLEQDISILEYKGEKINILEMMPWMSSYISPDENNVQFEEMEVIWDEQEQGDGSSVWGYGNQEHRDGPFVRNYGSHENILSGSVYQGVGSVGRKFNQGIWSPSIKIKGKILVDYKLVKFNDDNDDKADISKYLITIETDTHIKECLGKKTGEYFRIYRLKNDTMEFVYEKNFAIILPWKVDFGDIDGDGIPEIFIGAITETEYYPEAKRPFFFSWNGEHLIQKWTGSYIGFNELMDAKLLDTTNDGVDEVVLTAKTNSGELIEEVYRWENFSFYRLK